MTSPVPHALPHVTAMAAYALTEPLPSDWTSLAQNESAFAPSPRALAAAADALSSTTLYPDPEWTDLRAAISDAHGISQKQILCGAGSMELIAALIRAFVGPGDEVVGSQYGYLFVEAACQQIGARYLRAAETGFTVCPDRLCDSVTPLTRIVFLCNPGNPTGTRLANDQIVALRQRLPQEVMLVIDQAYAEFDDQDMRPVFDLVQSSNTVVLRTFSKAYGLAGARVGWGLFPQAIAAEVRKVLNPNNVPGVSQAMAAAAMRDQSHMASIVIRTAQLRDSLQDRLADFGFRCPESHTNFVLMPFADAEAAARADQRLRTARLLVRGMAGYALPHCLRATIGPPEAMTRLADVLSGGPAA
ncbi:MAG: histidinol-phosphate transaminase [Pseudomonadota bacterium]